MSSPLPPRRKLPRFIREELATPPIRGGGLHRWLFGIARQLHRHRSPDEIIQLLSGVLVNSGVKPGEIEEAVQNSSAHAWRPNAAGAVASAPRWPERDEALRATVLKCGGGVFRLLAASSVRLEDHQPSIDELLGQLFPGNPLLCCGWDAFHFETRSRDEWRGGLERHQFIVPSPMLRVRGLTKQGRESARCLDNTGPRRYLVVECDHGSKDEQATILLHLSCRARLAMVVDSGGKSLHGWFPCEGGDEDDLRRFHAYAVKLGADPATFSRCQQVRMPGGLRDTGVRQRVLFFRPEVLQ